MHQAILKLAWPAIATNVTIPLLSLVDVAIVGHIGSAAYIGAIAIGGAMFNMLYWLFNFLRMGTSGITAQAYGADNMQEATRTLVRSLIIALSISTLMIALQVPLADIALSFIDAGGVAQGPAKLYFSIAIWGAPGVLSTYALSGWFLGMQTSKPILIMALVANGLNILLSLMFVFVFHLDLVGVAAGTAISQWVSALVGAILMMRLMKKIDSTGWRQNLMEWKKVRHFFSVNTDIFLRTLCLVVVTIWFTRAGTESGVETLAANTLLMQLFMLFSFFMDGFAFAGEALAGRFYGGGEYEKLKQCVQALMNWGICLALLFTVFYYLACENILTLLTADMGVVRTALDYKLWAVAVPIASFLAFIWDGVFVGLTRTRQMLIALFVAMIVFFVVLAIFKNSQGNHALWMAFLSYLAARGIVQTISYKLTKRQ
jgi:MATE family multidrug resistance protein